jgi:hypothetical protein
MVYALKVRRSFCRPHAEQYRSSGLPSQTWRVEIRFDVTGTPDERDQVTDAVLGAMYAVSGCDGPEVTAIFDDGWEEV